jgi:hypothetical protein
VTVQRFCSPYIILSLKLLEKFLRRLQVLTDALAHLSDLVPKGYLVLLIPSIQNRRKLRTLPTVFQHLILTDLRQGLKCPIIIGLLRKFLRKTIPMLRLDEQLVICRTA